MLTPDEIASRQFLVSLRGYDRAEVSRFLQEVAADLAELQGRLWERERELEEQRRLDANDRDAGTTALGETADAPAVIGPDPRDAFRALGEETTRILVAAEESAAEIRARAEQAAEAEREEAERAASEIRQQATQQAEELREQARRDVEAELEDTRRRAREDLEEARSSAAAIVEEAAARRAAVTEDLQRLQAARDQLREQLVAASAAVGGALGALEEEPAAPSRHAEPAPVGRSSDEEAGGEEAGREEAGGEEAAPEAPRDGDARVEDAAPPPTPGPRAERGGGPRPALAARGAVTGDGAPDPGRVRDASLAGVRPGMLRRLKRGLQDVQNGVLDALRRHAEDADAVALQPQDGDLAPLGSVAETFLTAAYRAGVADGAAALGREAGDEPGDPSRVPAAAATFRSVLYHEIRSGLGPTLQAGLAADEPPTSLSERVGEVFRDLKGPVLETVVDEHLAKVHGFGMLDAWRAGGIEGKRWVVGEEPRCPESRCRTNAAEGVVALDDAFPSGETVPPAHGGCTCALRPEV